ncbi:MAG TPA: aminoglycoside phosphotransferase family protein [Burkholderiales bacterium]|nr:aminoglycoside phosphotransferase family protein [Burkholderiales bacterium]
MLHNEELLAFLRRAGLVRPEERPPMQPLTGGVSSDIWKVDLERGPVCVKRALARLRVAQTWEAPVERNRYEYEWFRVAGEAAPGAVPKVLAQGEGAFAMEYLDPARYPVWKELLRQGRADPPFATAVGAALAKVHAFTSGKPDVAARFATDDIFHAIRLEPYLLATARKHPDVRERLNDLASTTAQTRTALVHGDVSPKNILAGPHGPVFLDAECAWYGDPAFDLAFCLNHLLLKCLWVPPAAPAFMQCFKALLAGYRPADGVAARTAALLPALLLARVDGKSPVEYLTTETQKNHVRQFARPRIQDPVSLPELAAAWHESLK